MTRRHRSRRGTWKGVDAFAVGLLIVETAGAAYLVPLLLGAFGAFTHPDRDAAITNLSVLAFFSAIVGLGVTFTAYTFAIHARALPVWMRVLIVVFPGVVTLLGAVLCGLLVQQP